MSDVVEFLLIRGLVFRLVLASVCEAQLRLCRKGVFQINILVFPTIANLNSSAKCEFWLVYPVGVPKIKSLNHILHR